jgi:PKD repeat protein
MVDIAPKSWRSSHVRRALLAACGAGLLTVALGLARAPAVRAFSSTPDRTWVPDGGVEAIARTGNVLYIGGSFDRIGPRTGPGIGFSQSTGANSGLPEVSGGGAEIVSSIPDGTGGFYIGGWFTRVGGLARNNVAHIRADKTVDPTFDPNVTGTAGGTFAVVPHVDALALSPDGSTLYIGGGFNHVGGQLRHALAAVSAVDGGLTGFDAQLPPQGVPGGLNCCDATIVSTLAASGSIVYAGGNFTNTFTHGLIGRAGLAAFDATTGSTTAWDPAASGGSSTVLALAVSGDGATVFVSGNFTSIGGQSRNGFAALNASDAHATSLNPSPLNNLRLLALSGNTLYLGNGDFTVNGNAHRSVAAVNSTNGSVTGFDPNPGPAGSQIQALAVSGSVVYAAGNFATIGGQPRRNLAALNASDGTATTVVPPAPNCPPGTGCMTTLATSGTTAYAGGSFSSTDGVVRKGIAAIDTTTGIATAWDPNGADLSDIHALALSADGTTVYAGGRFVTIGGQTRRGLVALKASDGTATAWDPVGADLDIVNALALSGSTVYVGGQFTNIGGQARHGVAAVNAGDGLATAFDPAGVASPHIDALVVSPDGATVYVGGIFSSLGGQPRAGLAAVGAADGVATAFNANAGAGVEFTSLALSGSLLYVGGSFGSSTGGQLRNGLAALNISDGTATSWNPAGAQIVFPLALAVSGTHVFVGGQFATIGGQPRANVAELNASDGSPAAWNPAPSNNVNALAVAADGTLYVGGSFQTMELAAANSFAAFNSAGVDDLPPVAAFTAIPNPVPTGQSVAFDGTGSSDPDGTVSSYRWDFGDATVSTSSAPSHAYAAAGSYVVSLTVTDNSGSANTISHAVTVTDRPPVAAFTISPNPVLHGQLVSFDASGSSDPDGQVTTYSWDFGDGNFGSGASPTWTYGTPGSYIVKLTVTDNSGTTNTISHTVTVTDLPPVAAFTFAPNPVTTGQAVSFAGGGSSDPDGQVTGYSWDFGDSSSSTSSAPSHAYAAAGSYIVKLTVTDNSGSTNAVSHTVTVTDRPPVAAFTFAPNPVLTGQAVTFAAGGSSDPDGQVTAYAWDFGDSTSSTSAAPSHAYAAIGTYTVKLTVTDNSGNTNAISHTVTVSPVVTGTDLPPVAAFTAAPNPVLTGLPVSFDASRSSDPDGGQVIGYSWDFGDSTFSTSSAPSHAYAVAGSYTVALTVTDNGGNSNTTSQTITITDRPPVAAFTLAPNPVFTAFTGGLVRFDASGSSDPDGQVTAYAWDFGDGTTGAGATPAHAYTVGSTYTVKLTVTDNSGSKNTTRHTVDVIYALRLLAYCDPAKVPPFSLPPGSVVNNSAGGDLHAILQSGPGITTVWFHVDGAVSDTYHGIDSSGPYGLAPHSVDQTFRVPPSPSDALWWGGLSYGTTYPYHAWASSTGGTPIESPVVCYYTTPPKPPVTEQAPVAAPTGITDTISLPPGGGTGTITADPVPGPGSPGAVGTPGAPEDSAHPPTVGAPCLDWYWVPGASPPPGFWLPSINFTRCPPKARDLPGPVPRAATASNAGPATGSAVRTFAPIAEVKRALKGGKNKLTLRFTAAARRSLARLAHHGRAPLYVVVTVKAVGVSQVLTHIFKVSVPVGRRR